MPTPGCPQWVCNMFSVMPASGIVGPTDKPLPVAFCVLPKKELMIKDQPILQCKVIEPKRSSITSVNVPSGSVVSAHSVAVTGEAIANIPIRVSCQSSFSRHVIRVVLDYFISKWLSSSAVTILSGQLNGNLACKKCCCHKLTCGEIGLTWSNCGKMSQ